MRVISLLVVGFSLMGARALNFADKEEEEEVKRFEAWSAALIEAAQQKATETMRLAREDVNSDDEAATSLPLEVFESVDRGELLKMVQWLDKGGSVDAYSSVPTNGDQNATFGLLHAAATQGHLEIAKELLQRGANVDLRSSPVGGTALMDAAEYGHVSLLLLLLNHSANPDLQEFLGGTALMLAAEEGQVECVKALLRAKANTELTDDHGFSAVCYAEGSGHTGIAKLIRQHAAPPQPATASPSAPQGAGKPEASPLASLPLEIYESAQRGELQKMVKWLRMGGPVDALCSNEWEGVSSTFGLLHAAVFGGQLEIVRELLKRGASVDLQDNLGSTALMAAAYNSSLSIVHLLLQHGANPDLQMTFGMTGLMIAATNGQEECVQALLQVNANTELLDVKGRTALLYARAYGYKAIAKLIRQHAAPPQPDAASPAAPLDAGKPAVSPPTSLPLESDESAERGKLQKISEWLGKGGSVDELSAPLQSMVVGFMHSVAISGNLEFASKLLKRGVSVDAQSCTEFPCSLAPGYTALMGAAHQGHLPFLLFLLQHSANPDLQIPDHGGTALMMAASKGQEACVQALLQAKANTELLDVNGRAALHHAEAKGHTAIAELIRQHAAPLQPATASPSDAVLPLKWPWVVLSVVLGAIASVAFIRNFTAPV